MPLPFKPEPIDRLQERLPKAFEEAFYIDPDTGELIGEGRPGQDRTHVFDLEAGVRVIASLDRFQGGTERVHLSASLGELTSTAIYKAIQEGSREPKEVVDWVLEQLYELFGQRVPIESYTFTKKGVLHLFVMPRDVADRLPPEKQQA